jgi:hypothetical protein
MMIDWLRRFWRAARQPSQVELATAALMMRDVARQVNDIPTPPPRPRGRSSDRDAWRTKIPTNEKLLGLVGKLGNTINDWLQ